MGGVTLRGHQDLCVTLSLHPLPPSSSSSFLFFSPPALSPFNFLSLTTQGCPGCQSLLVGVQIGTIALADNLSNAIKSLNKVHRL